MPNVISGSKILVTGGAGTIGSHIVDALIQEKPAKIVVYDNFSEGKMKNLEEATAQSAVPIEIVSADIRSREDIEAATQGIDYVFHEASLLLLESEAKRQKAIDVNIQGSFNVFQSCVKNKVKKIVWASSASVFGDPLYLPVDEKHPYNNQTFYGATKVACEQFAVNHFHQFGMKHIGLRYYNVYGPRQSIKGAYAQILPRWLDRIDENQPIIIFGDGTQSMDMIYLEDIARANILALKSDVENEFFNIGTGVETSVKQLADLLIELTGYDKKPILEPKDVNLVKKRRCSTEKCEKLIGFKAKVTVREGVQNYMNWRRENLKAAAVAAGTAR